MIQIINKKLIIPNHNLVIQLFKMPQCQGINQDNSRCGREICVSDSGYCRDHKKQSVHYKLKKEAKRRDMANKIKIIEEQKQRIKQFSNEKKKLEDDCRNQINHFINTLKQHELKLQGELDNIKKLIDDLKKTTEPSATITPSTPSLFSQAFTTPRVFVNSQPKGEFIKASFDSQPKGVFENSQPKGVFVNSQPEEMFE